MTDPLSNFCWSRLHTQYDKLCQSYLKKSQSKHGQNYLHAVRPTPPTDRDLYYWLAGHFAAVRRASTVIGWASYLAMLYWKLYSTGTSVCHQLWNGPRCQKRVQSNLASLCAALPAILPKNAHTVKQLVLSLGGNSIHGMGPCAFAVRTTFLHFFYPDIVPICDEQTLKAIGIANKDAGRHEVNLVPYFENVWDLESTYRTQTLQFTSETAVRAIEMALWITGHGGTGACH